MLGAEMGQLIPPDTDNIEGFWENAKLVDFNNKIFEALGLHWDATVPLPQGWLEKPEIQNLSHEVIAWIGNEFNGKNIIALKDPRLCRTMPFWLKVTESINAEPYFIHIFRAVGEVISSFASRKWEASLEKACILNALHVTEALVATKNHPRVMIAYTDLLENPEKSLATIYNLHVQWRLNYQEAVNQISSVIKKQLRNQTTDLKKHPLDAELIDYTMRLENAVNALLQNDAGTSKAIDALAIEIVDKIQDTQRWFGFWHDDAMKAHGSTMFDLHKRNLQLREYQSVVNNYTLHTKQLEEHASNLEQRIAHQEQERTVLIQAQNQLNLILNSRGWKILERLHAMKAKLLG